MKIRLLFFASLREALGPGESLDLPEGVTVEQVRSLLVQRGGRFAELLGAGQAVRCAVNQTLCAESVVLEDGGELAFFPPVTGG